MERRVIEADGGIRVLAVTQGLAADHHEFGLWANQETFNVAMATSALEAATLLRQQRTAPPDAVLCDMHLAGNGGLDLLKVIREQPQYRHMPVVMLGSPADQFGCMKAGATEFVAKPFSAQDISDVLLTVLLRSEKQHHADAPLHGDRGGGDRGQEYGGQSSSLVLPKVISGGMR